jgi:hypothetical protein
LFTSGKKAHLVRKFATVEVSLVIVSMRMLVLLIVASLQHENIQPGSAVAVSVTTSLNVKLICLDYEPVGEMDSRLATVSDWEEPIKKGVVYYLGEERGARRVAVECVEEIASARQQIAESVPF